MSNNELTIKNQGYMGIADFNISDRFSEELAGLDSSFDRIKIPAGGGTMFEVPGNNPNEPDAVKEFSAVIPQIYPIFAGKSHLFIYSYDRYNSQLYCFCPTRTARIHRAACIEKHQQPCIGAARPGTGQSRHSESE